jgi:alkaline phosphatase
MYKFLLFSLILQYGCANSQSTLYSVANAHSHNDYEQDLPFWKAYKQAFGSIEADIFLRGTALAVAHDSAEVDMKRTLDSLYLRPLQQCIQKNGGHVYPDSSRNLILLIDIKTEARSTLDQLVKTLENYPSLIQCKSLQLTISGNRPAPDLFTTYPAYIWFDGVPDISYSKQALARVGLMSDNMRKHTKWNGSGLIPVADRDSLEALVNKTHGLQKRLRLWNAPDNINTWFTLIKLKVDLVNTDKIPELAAFLRQLPEKVYTVALQDQ